MDSVIRIQHLHFSYQQKDVLRDLNITVPEGAIYGFLGKNGAGKTTTIKILLGLIRVQSGKVFVFDRDMNDERSRMEILRRTGSFVESHALYPNMKAREYLKVKQVLLGLPERNIDETLEMVELRPGKLRIREFSLGMKQRLCLAYALLNKPSLLVLDEPANGLDPAGIIAMRELLMKLNREYGITIFVSSHLLTEIEKTVTHLGVISNNRIVFQGTTEELQQNAGGLLRVGTGDIPRAMLLLEKAGYRPLLTSDNKLQLAIASMQDIHEVNKLLVDNNVPVFYLNAEEQLEQFFMQLTNN